MSLYIATKRRVLTRGRPPDSFLDRLVRWGRHAPDAVFAPNDRHDIYAIIHEKLGPWRDLLHRRAAMLEALRVLAGFESSWRWTEGRDHTNPNVDRPANEETGAFQVSADSMDLDPGLREYVVAVLGSDDTALFIQQMKRDPDFAIGYAARVLRVTTAHHGPVKRLEIVPWLYRPAMREFERLLKAEDSTT